LTPNPWLSVDVDTVPAKRARELRDAWEEFFDPEPSHDSEGSGTPSVRRAIVDSWRRSRDAGVDPSGRQAAPSVVDAPAARARWSAHPLSGATAIIEQCLADTAVEADTLIVVGDADGTLLSVRGSARMRNRAADSMNFAEGTLWSESGAGTNAVGTALAAGHAVQVFAAEHFTESVQRWTCAAAPVHDADGEVIGLIDLTGDFSGVHPHNLAVVMATAQAVEVFLRFQQHERDDALRARYQDRLDSGAVRRALSTASGRIIAGSPRYWGTGTRLKLPPGGGELLLPSGASAVAEQAGDDAFVITRMEDPRGRTSTARPLLELTLLGPGPPTATLGGVAFALRPRHAELLAVLEAHPQGANAELLCAEIYGDEGHPGSVRVEMSRLRKLLPGCIEADRYRLVCDLRSDGRRVRDLLRSSAVRGAARAYAGPLLPESEAPRVVDERAALEGWLRTAVLGSDDVEALWAWVQCPSGEDDLLAWSRLLAGLDFEDPRRSLAAARTRSLRDA
jgi:hypothetical protein